MAERGGAAVTARETLPPLAGEDHVCADCRVSYAQVSIDRRGFGDEISWFRPHQWERVVTRIPGEQRTARWLVRQAIHEGRHHLNDTRNLGDAVSART